MDTNKIISDLGQQIEQGKEGLRNLKSAYNDVMNGKFRYRVELHSLWWKEGEDKVISSTGSELWRTIKHAEKKFMKEFSRSDVQATTRVFVVTDRNYEFVIDVDRHEAI